MEKKVFILGAGVSALVGIPTMQNFVSRSKDLYASNRNKYKDFEKVYSLMDQLDSVRRYLNIDLQNIESVLSVLEMDQWLGDNDSEIALYKEYIKTVIKENTNEIYTPNSQKEESPITGRSALAESSNAIYGKNYTYLIAFICCIFEIDIKFNYSEYSIIKSISFQYKNNNLSRNSIVTFNYDLTIEKIFDYMITNGLDTKKSDFILENYLVKIHGSINTDIILPSWSKGKDEDFRETWIKASQEIRDANHIIFLGFSMPQSDSYLKYFIGSALKKCFNLKSISSITLDNDGNTMKRFQETFKNFNNFRFASMNLSDYFLNIFFPEMSLDNIDDDRFLARHNSLF
ncbi:SIR2 family protein [Leptospira yasudae]|uniref:SIR2 family protein n=1 Tax=Leptospira yasudae TaxID=2202201 RepID=UPI0014384B08|nr:SIR2 family protein [Leptospira yasudae]